MLLIMTHPRSIAFPSNSFHHFLGSDCEPCLRIPTAPVGCASVHPAYKSDSLWSALLLLITAPTTFSPLVFVYSTRSRCRTCLTDISLLSHFSSQSHTSSAALPSHGFSNLTRLQTSLEVSTECVTKLTAASLTGCALSCRFQLFHPWYTFFL
jgi:hypothetical protein